MANRIGHRSRRVVVGFAVAMYVFSWCAISRADVHLVVGTPEQGGQYATVQAAVDAVPAENTERYVINIKPGTYVERVKIPTTKPLITLRGEDPLTTKLTYNKPANALPNDNRNWASTVVEGKDFIAENLAFENSYGTGVQALALYAKADRLIFNNCRFLGNQDTLRSESGRHYFYNSYVEGTVDFIYGKGTAYFENSTLFAKSNGYLTAHGREQSTEATGYVFKNATITGSAANGSVYLGRPWAAYARVVFIDSKIGPVINPAGWATWSGNNHLTADFHEYNSMDLNGDPLDVSQRVSWSEQLTAEQLAPFSKANWLAGSDGWNPVIEDVVAGQLGDYNGDGVVDALDYTVWRNHLGETDETNLNNNGDGGDVSPADYDLWKAHYGETNSGAGAGGLASVPESGALGVLFALVGCMAGSRFRPTR